MFKSAFFQSAGFLLLLVTSLAGTVHASDATTHWPKVDFAGKTVTSDARTTALWVAANADNRRLPFVIIDKKNAQAFVFDANRQLRGATPVLLGLAVGDDDPADMSSREVSSLLPSERTTPAGRFDAEPGRNLKGEEIVWLDYSAKLAIHRLRPDFHHERRAHRLSTASAEDNRISLGCIVVPVAFYEKVIQPLLGKSRSVVYVLPETRALQTMLGTLQPGLH